MTGSGTYIEVARKLMDENAQALRDVYEAVLSDPHTTARQRARVTARIRQLEEVSPRAGADVSGSSEPG